MTTQRTHLQIRALLQELERAQEETQALRRQLDDLRSGRVEVPIPFFSITPAEYVLLWERLADTEAGCPRCAATDSEHPREALKRAWKAHQALWPDSSQRFRAAIRHAYSRGHVWNLSPSEYEPLASSPCSDCGQPTGRGIGLDRLDSKGSYEVGNVRPCCGTCNVTRGRGPLPPGWAEKP